MKPRHARFHEERMRRHEAWAKHAHWHGPPHFYRARRLHRQLFFSFGAAIGLTLVTTWSIFAFSHFGGHPWLRPLGLCVSAILVWTLSGVVARRIAYPLRDLSRVAKDLGEGKLESRASLSWRGSAEVRELATSINDMAERIEQQVKTQRELLGAVSHELRTPLARMRVLLAIAQDRELARLQPHAACHPETCKAAAESIASMEREIIEMDALVGELLAGARVDAGVIERRTLGLLELATEAIERVKPLEGERGLTVALELAPGLEQVDADATLLARALAILIDNAKRHGASSATLRIAREGELIRFALDDDGPGFAADDLERVFTPFARGHGKAPDEQAGVGLGLYLLKRIAEAHGGRAFAENRAPSGARVGFTVRGESR
jgi:signal transduction histidine kinase